MKIVFSSNISWSVYNFRLGLLKSLQKEGHEIFVVASRDDFSQKLMDENFNFYEINLNNNSTNPFEDIKNILNYYKIYKKIQPDVICHNAIKPNIYGTIVANFLKTPTLNNISGLGTLFIKEGFSTRIAKMLYKFSQKRASKVFFQNTDDLNLFINNKLVSSEKCELIPGSGVNTDKFKPVMANTRINKKFNFLFIGRLIYDKGIREYIEASEILKIKYPEIAFNVLGPIYKSNSTAIKKEDLDLWIKNGTIFYLGETDRVDLEMENASCIVLPSYREGMSKVLIEASSMGLPIVTTNVPGCKDVIVNNETGFLAEVRDSSDLAMQMEKMFLLSDEERNEMGRKARKRAIEVFDEKIIIKYYKNAIYSIT